MPVWQRLRFSTWNWQTPAPSEPAASLCDRFAIDEHPIDHDAVLDLATATGLTACDATYRWLARQLGAELVTLDRQLARAAAR